jgi:hypothetical protein
MAKISTYGTDGTPSLSDKVIGTDVGDSNNTKNYLISDLAQIINETAIYTPVLAANSTISQEPSGIGVATQVSFGAAQSNATLTLAANGLVTFLETGSYLINGYGSAERQGSSGGLSILLFRFLVDGVQVGPTKGFHLDATDVVVPYEITFPLNITTAGTTVSFEIMRDDTGFGAGKNQGGLYPHSNASGWSNVPSADLNIWKIQ